MPELQRKARKTRIGVVVSDKMQKSVVVVCKRTLPHSTYRKIVTRSLKVMAHDEGNSAKVGDTVEIMETRPLSKRKRWRIVQILRKADGL